MAANFEVKFIVDRVSGNYKLQITDTSTGFTLAKANTKITFPDGYVVENTDVSNPDISTPGGNVQRNLRLDVLNRVVTGDYTILFTAYDASDNEYTSQKQFNFTWQEPTILIQDLSDAGIPQVKFKDITVWDQGNFTETASTRGLSSLYPTTSLISGQSKSASQTDLGEALELDMINSGNYYEGVYPVTLSIDILYSHTNGYLTVQYVKSSVDNVVIKRTPTQTELLTKINTYKERIDAYRTTNPAVYAKLFEEYDNVVALYSHAISRYRIGIGDGAQESIAQILELIDDDIPHSYLSTPITSFVINESDFGINQIVTKLEEEIGTFDAEGNLVSIAKSFADEVFNVEATEFKAEASKLTTLLAQFGTYDANTNTFTFSGIANYFEQVKTYADNDKASAQALTTLTSQFGTYDAGTNTFTFSSTADYFEQVKTYADNDKASALALSTLTSQFGTYDPNTNTFTFSSTADYFEQVKTYADENSAAASKISSIGAAFGSFDGNTFNFSEAKITQELNTYTGLDFSNSTYFIGIEAEIASKPIVFRQATEPVTTYATGSIWYDTDDENKVYILVDGTPKVWTLTDDSRIGATATQLTTLTAAFGSYDPITGLTIDTTADYFAEVKSYADTQSAAATKIENLGAELVTFDANGNVTGVVLSAEFKSAIDTFVSDEANSALASKVEGLRVDVEGEDGTGGITAQVTENTNVVASRPKIFRQDAEPATTEPVGSLWFDTDNDNKAYVLVAGTPNVWTETTDDRVADLIGFAEANYSLKVDANGVVTGLELYSASGPNTTTSTFKITADKFIVRESSTDFVPFTLDGTELKLNVPLNGVSGTFSGSLTAATGTFSGNVDGNIDGTAASTVKTNAADGATAKGVTDNLTSVVAITSSDIAIVNTGETKTFNDAGTPFYVDNTGKFSLGSKLSYDPSTEVLSVAGTITGSTGVFGDVTINSSGITATNFSIDALGNATLSGDITGSSGTFGDVVIDSNGITATNFSIDALGNVVLEGTITGSTGVFGDVTINSSGITATNFSIDALGNATLAGDITGSSGTFGDVVIDSNGITATNFGIDASGNVTLAGTLTGSTGVFGPVTINGSGISSTNFSIDASGNVTVSGDITGSNGEFSGSLNINDKFLVSSAGAVQVYAGAGATLGSSARFEILDDSGNSKYRLYGGGINFNAWAGGSNAFNSVDALGGGSLFFSDVAHVYAGNGTTTTANHGFTINVNGGSRKMFIKATELRIDPAAADPTNHTTVINGDLEVVGNVSFATTTTGDVTVSNLETRLGQIDSDIQIGADNTVDVTFPGNVQVNGILKGPATFTIDPSAYGDATGKVVILGDLQVDGTTTTINSTVVTVNDKILTLSNGAADSTAANDSGIEIAGALASFKYFHDGTKWVSNKDIEATNFLGNASTATSLAAARDISLSGAVTGTASFDGSANITITTSVNHNHDDRYYTETESDARFVNITGDTLTGDLNFNSEVKSRYYAAGLADANDRYEILGLGNTLMLRYWDNDQGNGTSINRPLMHLEWGGASDNSMVLYGDLILRNEMSVDPEVDVKILDMDVAGGAVNLTNVTNGTFLGALSAASITANNTLTVGSTNVYNALPTGVAFTTTDNRFKLQVTTNGGATAETTIAPLLLSDVLTEGYIPFVGTGDGGGATVNSRVSNSWLKLNGDVLELGNIADPVNVDAKSIKLSRQIGPGDKQVSELKAEGFFVTSTTATFGTKNSSLQFFTNGRLNVNGAFTLPEGDGTSGQVLSTNGSGDLSWVAAGGPTTSDLDDVTTNGAITTNAITVGGLTSGNIQANGWLQAFGFLYTRDNLRVLNAAGNDWNTWGTRNNGFYDLTVGTINATGSITAASFSGNGAGLTSVDADLLDGRQLDGSLGIGERLFNNQGRNHTTFTDFNSANIRAGVNYLQQSTNGPTGSSLTNQWYGFRIGLGGDYGTTTGVFASYASEIYWGRQSTGSDTYLWARDLENGTWGSWRKMSAGYADSSGSAGNADTLDSYHETAFLRLAVDSSSPTNGAFAVGSAGGRNFIQSHAGQPLDINPLGNAVTVGSDLSVSGTGSFGSHAIIGTAIPAGYYQDTSNGAYRALGTDGDRGYYFQSYNGSSTTMYVGLAGTYAGRVGIGTTSPAYKVHSTGTGRFGNMLIGSGTYLNTIQPIDDTNMNISTPSGSIYFNTQSGSGVYNAAGNFGIGTTSPAYNLDVNGNARVSGYNSLTLNGVELKGYPNNSLWFISNNSGEAQFVVGTSWDWDRQVEFRYNPATIGTPDGTLSIGQLQKNAGTWTHGNTTFYTDGTARMRLDSAGNLAVGVGTGATTALLTNAGRGNITVNGSADSILTLGVEGAAKAWFYTTASNTYLSGSSTLVFESGGVSNRLNIESDGMVTVNKGAVAAKKFRVYYDMDLYNGLNFTDSSWNYQGNIRGQNANVYIRSQNNSEWTFNNNGYFYAPSWINISGGAGIFSDTNGAHFYPNTYSNYGVWRINGDRGGYSGILLKDVAAKPHVMYDGGGNGGLFNEGNGVWPIYYHVGNDSVGIGGSATQAGYKAYVNGNARANGEIVANGPLVTAQTGTAGYFGAINATWGGNTSSYPTLYSASADRWVMHINPHISYTQNGVNGFSGSMTGATIRMAGQPGATTFWDMGIGVNSVGIDVFSIGRTASSFFKMQNTGQSEFSVNTRYVLGLRNLGAAGESNYYPWLTHDYGSQLDYGNASQLIIHFNGIGDRFKFNRYGAFEAESNVSTKNWFRTSGGGGLYFQSYARGLQDSQARGNTYGNCSTYNSGHNGWDGWTLGRSNISFMGSTTDCGIYAADVGVWALYYIEGTNGVGIRTSTTSSSYAAYVGGSLYATGDIVAYSDRRVKENIINIDSALDKVKALQGVYYNRINDKDKVREIGFIAQDVHDAVPELASYAKDVDEWGVKYSQVTGLHNEAIKELAQELDKKDEQIANLQAQIDELKKLILNK